MKKIIKFFISKTFIIGIFLLLQLIFSFVLVYYLTQNVYIGFYVQMLFSILSVIIVLKIVSSSDNPTYKLAWVITVLAFPIFGTFFYIFYHQNNINSSTVDKHLEIVTQHRKYLSEKNFIHESKETNYIESCGWRYYKNTETKFFKSGEEKFENLFNDLKQANKFIFLEYFILKKGVLFNSLIEILTNKVNDGVIVKIIYDDFGSADSIPFNFIRKMKDKGIEVIPFNPMRIHLNFAMNYRDHRKIVVIDNKIAYTGGINIGDEYINKVKRFGHWNDVAIRLEGEAVWSLTLTFIENWNFSINEKKWLNPKQYFYKHISKTDGIVAPFADNPIDDEQTTRNLFLYLINQAKSEILITTPYLIFDNELSTALKLAVKSGVKINIIIPKVPDKKLVYSVTESFALDLVQFGINVYKYDPGFIHAKTLIVDNNKAIIGTTNLDFRSLYLHFENNVYLEDSKTIIDIVNYFNDTLDVSTLQSERDLKKRSFVVRVFQALLRGFAPIL